MGRFLSLFHCESFGSNRRYEDRFQWFFVSRDEKNNLSPVEPCKMIRLLGLVRNQPANTTALDSLARILGTSLEPRAYDLFLEEIGPLVIVIFYEDSVQDTNGFPDNVKTKELHYPKYRMFKFASFLDLLRPDSVPWRGNVDLAASAPFICSGADQFQSAWPKARTLMLSRWIRLSGPSAFSEKSEGRSQRIMERQIALLGMEKMSAKQVAKELDVKGFKCGRHSSYHEWFTKNPASFHAWLSKERKKSREAWKR